MKILQIHEKEGLSVGAKWFNNSPIYDKKDIATDFVTHDYPQCINFRFLRLNSKN